MCQLLLEVFYLADDDNLLDFSFSLDRNLDISLANTFIILSATPLSHCSSLSTYFSTSSTTSSTLLITLTTLNAYPFSINLLSFFNLSNEYVNSNVLNTLSVTNCKC